MKPFFNVISLNCALKYKELFKPIESESVEFSKSYGSVLAQDIVSDIDIPDFNRSTMDGYALCAKSTFGASNSNPAYINITGSVAMGKKPDFKITPGDAAQIPTGGMLPFGADSVVMVEHTDPVDSTMIEVYKSVAPQENVIKAGEDFKKKEVLLKKGSKLKTQDIGVLAALGKTCVPVYKKPVVGIISTGDEIISPDKNPTLGQIRDINSHILSAMINHAGGISIQAGIVKDDFKQLYSICEKTLNNCDMLIISGGSSVGTRDYTIDVLTKLSDSKILFQGISISPGKPTILAKTGNKPIWGLPGHVASAMIIFKIVVNPFLSKLQGINTDNSRYPEVTAILTRNISSAHGRTDFIRVKIFKENNIITAEPVLGKSGLINTIIKGNGLIKIDENTEGLQKGTKVQIIPL